MNKGKTKSSPGGRGGGGRRTRARLKALLKFHPMDFPLTRAWYPASTWTTGSPPRGSLIRGFFYRNRLPVPNHKII